ncbi:unnamed protein product [Heligmosomoides polygyrus]|uniref:Uncharacterized protein n=1 Tax=Heligmosomoides polygyrus TaxID=6339 RepID=A0A183F2U4_HELPZ|nr:unnamed protein product [Heligmosomoides polygyrus]
MTAERTNFSNGLIFANNIKKEYAKCRAKTAAMAPPTETCQTALPSAQREINATKPTSLHDIDLHEERGSHAAACDAIVWSRKKRLLIVHLMRLSTADEGMRGDDEVSLRSTASRWP